MSRCFTRSSSAVHIPHHTASFSSSIITLPAEPFLSVLARDESFVFSLVHAKVNATLVEGEFRVVSLRDPGASV
jgi:hypothetical protein